MISMFKSVATDVEALNKMFEPIGIVIEELGCFALRSSRHGRRGHTDQCGRYRAIKNPQSQWRCGFLTIYGDFDGTINRYFWSGRRDSNSRPLAPHASALPGCATPRKTESISHRFFLHKWRTGHGGETRGSCLLPVQNVGARMDDTASAGPAINSWTGPRRCLLSAYSSHGHRC